MNGVMNQDDVKVTFYLKKNETNEHGECPVIGRLSIGRHSEPTPCRAPSGLLDLPKHERERPVLHSQIAFSAKLSAPAALWVCGRVCGKSAAARAINRHLDEIRASALSIYRELSATRDNVSAGDVRRLLLGMANGQETLLSYFRTHNEQFDKRVGVNREESSAHSYRYALDHVTRFLRDKYQLSDLPFTALDRSFIERYDLHLRTDCHSTSSTNTGTSHRTDDYCRCAITRL